MKNYSSSVKSFVVVFLLAWAPPLFADGWSGLGTGLDLPDCNGSVEAVFVSGVKLYAGGDLAEPGGTRGIARWDPTLPTPAWQAVGGGFPAGYTVRALTGQSGDLYAGGDFITTAGGTTVNRIAKWNGTSWSALGATPGADNTVWALAAKGSKVYAGGAFTSAGGVTGTSHIAYWETAETPPVWHAMGSGITTSEEGLAVYAIAVTDDGSIYAGGQIVDTDPTPDVYYAFLKKWNGSAWTDVTGGPSGGTSPIVYALTAKGNDLYVGGQFTSVGASIAVRGLAKLSGSTWSKIVSPGQQTEPWLALNAVVRAIVWNGPNQMYVTGNLGNSLPQPPTQIHHIFAFVNGAWSTSIPTTPTLNRAQCSSVNGYGRALAVDRFAGKVYVGGWFDTAGGIASPNIVAWVDSEPFTLFAWGTIGGQTPTWSFGYGINNLGEGAGHSLTVAGGWERGIWWRRSSGLTQVNSWDSTDRSYAFAVNDSSTVVGMADYLHQGTYVRGYRWNQTGTPQFQELGILNSYSEAHAINTKGDVAGISKTSAGYNRAVRWLAGLIAADDMQSLVGGGVDKTSSAFGINSPGDVVGRSITSSGVNHAFRTPITRAILPEDDLGTLGGTYSSAYAINDVGEVVGESKITGDTATRAFVTAPYKRIDEAGSLNLGTLPGDTYSIALGINGAGTVVGRSQGTGTQRAFVWFKGWSAIKNLNDYLPVGSTFVMESAEAINSEGRIVGWGHDASGYAQGFTLDPTQ